MMNARSIFKPSISFGLPGLFIVALLAVAIPLAAQQQSTDHAASTVSDKFSRFQHYTMEQGLSNNWITSIAQEDNGFMWFGTEEGLNRFDGEHFSAFFKRADGRGLPNDHVTQLIAVPGHRLLIGTEKGLCTLNTRSLEFQALLLPVPEEKKDKDQIILALHLDKKGAVWVATNAGVYLLDNQLRLSGSYFQPKQSAEKGVVFFVTDFFDLPDGRVASKCVVAPNTAGTSWQIIDFVNQKTTLLEELIPGCGVLDTALIPASIISDGRNNFWYTALGTFASGRLFHFDWKNHQATTLLPNNFIDNAEKNRNHLHHPFLLPDSLIFLQRYFGPPLIYNLRNGETTDLPLWKSSLPDGKSILNFVDRDGNLWLCPRFEGIYFLTLKNLPTTAMIALNETHKKTMAATGVSEEWFSFIGRENAHKWVITSGNGGLYSTDKVNKGVSGVVSGNPFQNYAYVNNLVADRGDTVWTNTLGGLFWYNPVSNSSGPLKSRISGLDSLDNRFLYRDRHGLIWGRVRNNGVCFFDTRSRKLTHFQSKGEHPPYPIQSATACSEGPDGNMWFSFGSEEKYLVRWIRSTGIFEKIEPICPPGIHCSKAFDMLADPHGNLWLYAENHWYMMDTRTRQVRTFGKEDGLATNNPAGICLDRDGFIWFATPYGLSRFDPRSSQLRTFYQSDGLLSNSILNVELIDTLQNVLFVSTDRGLCLFEPNKVGVAAAAPSTFITGLRVSDHEIPLPESGQLEFPYDKNDLRIEFTGVNFISGFNNRYQYSLEPEGQPADWKDAGTDNFANFLNLAPGHYTFLARTANSDGEWGKSLASLSILIYPPWWRTWTFQLSLLAALAAGGWWFYRRQISRAESREAEKAKVRQQMGDLEMRALRSQMNPHFVFNALNSVQNFILKNDTREASKYLTKFARLMRLILENSESPVVPLAREIELLRYYTELEALRFNHRFSFDFQIDSTINPESVAIPGMLIQPHIENAIWHGLMHKEGSGLLWVRFIKADEHTIVCEIEDNGVGRERAAEIEKDRPKNHRSTGLANIRNRLQLLNSQLANDISLEFIDLHNELGIATGTKVVVRMPMMLNQSFTASNN